ncbi:MULTISPECIES: hypothetical protein [unclassified Shewanella]|uniref:hypothetical protein n=1 Tax=unclassified Shewanella TaxID=196818 RepID=UPI003551B66A
MIEIFDNREQKVHMKLAFRSSVDPLGALQFFNDNSHFSTIFAFRHDFKVESGPSFNEGDFLFTTDKYLAVKEILDFDKYACIEFVTWHDENIAGLSELEAKSLQTQDGGTWKLSFSAGGNDLLTCLSSWEYSYLEDVDDRVFEINDEIEVISHLFIDQLLSADESPFFMLDRAEFEEDMMSLVEGRIRWIT